MTEFYIRLGYALGAGNIRAKRALEYFGNAENIFKVSPKERAESGIFTKNELLRIENSHNDIAVKTLNECKENGIDIICYGDKNYPYCLSVTEDAPALLYVKGTMPDFTCRLHCRAEKGHRKRQKIFVFNCKALGVIGNNCCKRRRGRVRLCRAFGRP